MFQDDRGGFPFRNHLEIDVPVPDSVIRNHREYHIFNRDLFSVTENRHVQRLNAAPHDFVNGLVGNPYADAVDFENFVPDLQTGCLRIVGTAVLMFDKCADHVGRQDILRHDEQGHDNHADQDVHERAGRRNDNPLPDRLAVECVFVVRFFILADHADKTADRQCAERIRNPRFRRTVGKKFRSHADGEFADGHAEQTRGQIMPEFVDKNQKTENKKCEQNMRDINENHYLLIRLPQISRA